MNREDAILEIQERYSQSGRAFNELQRRHWAAMEALKLGRGGISIVSKALRISPNTIRAGIQEISTGQVDSDLPNNLRIRRPGGGRKSKKSSLDPLVQSESKKESAKSEPEIRDSDRFDASGDEEPVVSHERQSLPGSDVTTRNERDRPKIL
jgi:hypothetical protein